MDTYFKIKAIVDYIIPFAIFGGVFVIWFVYAVIHDTIASIKSKILTKNGYQRYVYDVASVGNGVFYAWHKDNSRIKEKDIKHMSIKELKQWIKSEKHT